MGSVCKMLEGWKGCKFQTDWRLLFYVLMSLRKTLHSLLRTGSTQDGRKSSRHDLKIVDLEV